MTPHGFGLDTGALIALERGNEEIRSFLRRALAAGAAIHIVSGVVAQAWRGGPRQAVLARLLNSVEVTFPVLDAATARAVGEICGLTGHHDVIDVHVVLDARLHEHTVLTSDPDDLRRVDPSLAIIEV